MNIKNSGKLPSEECDHKWEPTERTHHGSHLKLKCVKCGATKEIELFP
ncbi:MAG: hypothetical protein QW445_04155 [Candidatus Bathyarchaeia archaeon]